MGVRSLAAWMAVLALLVAAPARGEPGPADRALATQLFKEARDLMAKKSYAEACPRFEESQRLDPGGGTLLNLALCHEAIGKTATAWAELNEAMAIAQRDGRPDREKLAQEHASALEPKLSRLVIDVPAESSVPDLLVMRDGSAVAQVAWGTAMAVDPGEHRVEASAPGRVAWSASVTVGLEADKQTVTVPVLEIAPVPEPPPEPPPVEPVVVPPPPPPPAPPPAPAQPPDEGGGPDHRAMLIAGLVVGGVGIVGLGVGIGFGVDAIAKKDESDAECVGGCTDLGAQRSSEAVTEADASTGLIVVGGIAAATGTLLVVLGVLGDDAEASVAVGPTGAALGARW
jgi:hypothetical protein